MLLTNVTPFTCFLAKTAPKRKHLRNIYIGQTSKKIQTRLTEHQNAINRHDHIVHFQLNTQTTADINLIGLKRDALDKLPPNMPVSLRKRGIVWIN